MSSDLIGIWKCWFLRRGENRSTWRKTSRSKDENQQQTQPTCDTGTGSQTRATMVGGERSLHCAIPAPLFQGLWQTFSKVLRFLFPVPVLGPCCTLGFLGFSPFRNRASDLWATLGLWMVIGKTEYGRYGKARFEFIFIVQMLRL